jgi:histone deacetylase HOS3
LGYLATFRKHANYHRQDGKIDLVQAASVSLHGPHGQHIENIHLQPYISDKHFFDVLYKERYSKLLQKAEEFVTESGDEVGDVLVIIRSVNNDNLCN